MKAWARIMGSALCEVESKSTPICSPWGCLIGLSLGLLASGTHLCQQPLATEVDVGQTQGCERPYGNLLQTPVTQLPNPQRHLTTPKTCSTRKRIFDLLRVLGTYHLVNSPSVASASVDEVVCLWRLAGNQILLAGIGRVTLYALFVTVQQVR